MGEIINSLHEMLLAKCDIGGGLDPRDAGIYSHLSFPLKGSTPSILHHRFGNRARHHTQRVDREEH